MAAGNITAKFSELGSKPYVAQATWFLNGFWETEVEVVGLNEKHEVVSSARMPLKDDAETVWKVTHTFMELDKKKDQGNELDEMQAHVLLERFSMTLTVIQMREALRKIDVDSNGKMSLMEYLVFRYQRGVEETVNAPQGNNEAEIKKAQMKVDEVQKALTEVQAAVEAQEKAVAEVTAAEEQCRQAQAAVEQAEREQEEAVAEVHKQEEAYHGLIKTLEDKANPDNGGSVVARNKAAAELAQVKAEDPLPLRKAKISSEATLRKVTKQRKEAQEKTAQMQIKRQEAIKKQEELNQAAADLDQKMEAAKAELEEVKRKGGGGQGAIWWMEREVTEAEKYLPRSKQRANK